MTIKVDCHIHTHHSGDSRTPIDRIEEAAIAAGLSVACITDHGTTAGGEEAAATFSEVRVVVGQECRTWAGEIIGLFLAERIPGNLQPGDVIERIHAQGGLVYLPHPFARNHAGLKREFIEKHLAEIDIIEAHNAKVDRAANDEAAAFAKSAGLAAAAASDAHYAEFVGRACVEIADFSTAAEFLAALRSPDAKLQTGTYSHAEARWPKRV